MKHRLKNENSGIWHDVKFSIRHKQEGYGLSSNLLSKRYKAKRVIDLPKTDLITSDFKKMIKILKKENILPLTEMKFRE